MGITVEKAPVSDGIGKYLKDIVPHDDENVENNIAAGLNSCGAEILLNYLPVGSTS